MDAMAQSIGDTSIIKNKIRQRQEKMVEYLGEMLEPQTEGFPHINLDMAFTNLSFWDLNHVDNVSMSILVANMYKLKQSEYLLRGDLATFLNSRRSKNAKSMDIFTTVVTKQEQEFKDKTKETQGFSFFKFNKNK